MRAGYALSASYSKIRFLLWRYSRIMAPRRYDQRQPFVRKALEDKTLMLIDLSLPCKFEIHCLLFQGKKGRYLNTGGTKGIPRLSYCANAEGGLTLILICVRRDKV